jgi:glycopeptide antibiotics resistance protein
MITERNFFIDKERIRTIDTFRVTYFLLSLFFFLIKEIGRNIYRPFIYENHIDDFGIADSIGNLGGILVQIFFGLAIFNSQLIKSIRLITFFILGYVLYEIIQPILPRGVFDWRDIYGTLIGGIIAVLLVILLHKVIKKNRIIFKFQIP